MFEIRLGDVIDDYCIKCRRLTNHSIVSIVEGAAAKVRCRTCYNDHDYRNEIAPPTKKELKKLALFNEVLAGAPGAGPADLVTDLGDDLGGDDLAAENLIADLMAEDVLADAPVVSAEEAAVPVTGKPPAAKKSKSKSAKPK